MTPAELQLWMPIFIGMATIIFTMIGGFLVSAYSARNIKRIGDGDIADKVSSAWERLNKPLLAEIDKLHAEIVVFRATQENDRAELEEVKALQSQDRFMLTEYIRGTKILIGQLARRGIKPDWVAPLESNEPTTPTIRSTGSLGMR